MRKFLSTQVPCPEAVSNSAAGSIRPPPSHFPQVMQYGRSGTYQRQANRCLVWERWWYADCPTGAIGRGVLALALAGKR
jgi:hypothetical protein